jgi:alkanesulfonate monooxygenase
MSSFSHTIEHVSEVSTVPLHPSIRRPIEFVGFVGPSPFSEVEEWTGAALQPDYIATLGKAHEDGDFDRVLLGYGADRPDNWQIAGYLTQQTERLGALIAHRPGFVAPTLAARYASTLDQFSQGRVALHMITGGSDADQARDGDFLPKERRYARTAEYMQLLRLAWTSTEPFDFDGEFYTVKDVRHGIRPFREHGIPLYFGGSSAVALDVAARYADLYAMFGEPVDDIRAMIADVKARATALGREIGFSVSLRPILGDTEDAAWDRAHRFLEIVQSRKQSTVTSTRFLRGVAAAERAQAEGAQRLLRAAAQGDVRDTRLWMAIARETGANANTTAPVGTPDQVAETILSYVDAGATTILIRGFEPLADAIRYGRELVPRVRQLLARRQDLVRAGAD